MIPAGKSVRKPEIRGTWSFHQTFVSGFVSAHYAGTYFPRIVQARKNAACGEQVI
jgi:hypothetical protein